MKTVKYLMTGILMLVVQHNMVMAQQQVSINEARKAAVQSLNLRQNNLSIGE